MKKLFRKVNSLAVAFAVTASLFTAMPVHASTYLYQDEDALLESKWTKLENYDAEHGNVYSFTTSREVGGTDLFTSGFADGTYVVSMDFKIPVYPASGKYIDIYVDSVNGNQTRTQLSLRTSGYKGYSISASGSDISGWHVSYGNEYTANAWNNYSIIYEKSGTTINISQYVNGIKLSGPYTGTDDFRLRRITVNTTNSGGEIIYLDNIVCRKIESAEELSIEKVSPILSGSSVTKLLVKCNAPMIPSTVSSVTVKKSGGANLVTSYKVVGQYIEASVSGLAVGDKYSLSLGGTPKSVAGTVYGHSVPYLHKDEDALLDSNWTKVENYDAEHGNVYSFTTSGDHNGTNWFTEEFADGTYVVSMDFKTPSYPTGNNQDIIMIDSEVSGSDRTLLYLRHDGYLAIEIKDAGGTRYAWATTFRTDYKENAWNNYSIVYKKSGTDVDVMQYVNGIALAGTDTRIYDNFRFKRIVVNNHASSSGIYLDNITCRKIESAEELSIENVSPILSGSNVSKLLVKLNEPVVPSTVSSVTVNKSGSNTNLVSSYKVLGQHIEVAVSGLTADDEYTLSLGGTPQSILGLNYDGNTYSYVNDVASDLQLYYGSTKLTAFDSSCADKTLKVVASLFNLGDKPTPTMLLSSLYSNSQETATAYANATNGENISTLEGVVIAHNVVVPAGADSNYVLTSFIWDDITHIRPLLKTKKIH